MWRMAKDALVALRHRREASDMLFEHRSKKDTFSNGTLQYMKDM